VFNMKDKTLATFSTESEAFQFIESNLMTNVIIDRDLFSGQFHVLDME